MKALRFFAPILIVVGIATLAYPGLRYALSHENTGEQNPLPLAAGGFALAGGIVYLVSWIKTHRAAVTLLHGCRTDYGPLELRIQATVGANGFLVCVEDPRLEHRVVYEQTVQSTLESAKEYVALRAHDYLSSYAEAARPEVDWRCS